MTRNHHETAPDDSLGLGTTLDEITEAMPCAQRPAIGSSREKERAMNEDRIRQILIGESAAIRAVRSLVVRIAPTRLPILIQGPTGAGKELVARALHICSGRKGAMVALNIAALADSLFESALFGHVRGAFSGALANAPGFLAEAHQGTLFMDEVGALPLHGQAKLLRALDNGVFRPVGGSADRRSDFRLIAATNEPLADMAMKRRFRADLAYRLQGFTISVPSLAERRDDIPRLVEHFANDCETTFGEKITFSPSALAWLSARKWPGNVRELRHAVECVAALATSPSIEVSMLSDGGISSRDNLRRDASAFDRERQELQRLLEAVAWDAASAARRLLVHPVTVYRRMKRLGIIPPAQRAIIRSPESRVD